MVPDVLRPPADPSLLAPGEEVVQFGTPGHECEPAGSRDGTHHGVLQELGGRDLIHEEDEGLPRGLRLGPAGEEQHRGHDREEDGSRGARSPHVRASESRRSRRTSAPRPTSFASKSSYPRSM